MILSKAIGLSVEEIVALAYPDYRKITFPCFADGASYEHPYADILAISCGFTGNGAHTDGAY